MTGLVAASNKTVQGISTHVLPAKSERALNKFLTEYDWDEDQFNKERVELLQQTNDTKWTSNGVVIIDDTFMHKTGEQIPNGGEFYDHTVPEYIWGQNLIYAIYADHLIQLIYERSDPSVQGASRVQTHHEGASMERRVLTGKICPTDEPL